MQYIDYEMDIVMFDAGDSFAAECASYNEGGMTDLYSIRPDRSDS